MNTLATSPGLSLRILDEKEMASVAGGGAALNWAVGGASVGSRLGAPAGPLGAIVGAILGAAYYEHYYQSTK